MSATVSTDDPFVACEGPTIYAANGLCRESSRIIAERGAAVAWVASEEHDGLQGTMVLDGTAPVQDTLL